MDELQTQSQVVENNPSSPSEVDAGVDEGGAAAAPPPAAVEAPAPKSGLEKLKDKAAAGVAPQAKTAAELAAQTAAAAAVPAWKPNTKFKAAGKEMEVPPMLQALMKDQKSQEYIHSLLSKAHGIEMIQEKLKSTREDRTQLFQAYQQMRQPIELGQEAYKRGDLDTVFGVLKIDPNKVLQWAYNKVELSQMDPAQRQIHEAKTAAERKVWENEREQRSLMAQGQQTQTEQIHQMLDLVLERPEFTELAQRYDERMQAKGKTFRDLCLMMGEQAWNQGKQITPLEAAKHAAELLGDPGKKQADPTPANPAPAQVAQPAAPAQETKKTLPNVGGSKSAAPAKSKIRSLDDLKKARQQILNS
jgi:hypothetical protein